MKLKRYRGQWELKTPTETILFHYLSDALNYVNSKKGCFK